MIWDTEGGLKDSTAACQSYRYDGRGRRALVRTTDVSQQVQVYSQKGELLSAQSINAAGTFTSNTKYHLMDGKAVLDVNDSPPQIALCGHGPV